MATNQVSAAKQLAISLKAAAKLILVTDRENTKLGQQLEKVKARLEATKGGTAAPVAKRGPKAKAAVAEQPVKATRAKRVPVEEQQEQPKKRGPKPGAKKAAPVVETKAPGKRGPKPGAKKAAVEVVKAKAGKTVKKAKSGNDDFLLP
jgi:hypothetical protein